MSIQQVLESRVSCPLVNEDMPTDAQLQKLLQAAVAAPDHGRLRPWRFVVFKGEQRQQLGNILAAAKLQDQPDLPESAVERLRAKPLRAPVVIAVVAEVTEGHRVPVLEQIISTGCAAQQMMLSAYAQGLGIMWRTGALASHTAVKTALGFAEKDEIVAFLYVGTPARSQVEREQLDANAFVRSVP